MMEGRIPVTLFWETLGTMLSKVEVIIFAIHHDLIFEPFDF